MNVPSLLFRPDRSTCQLDLHGLSDQARMELLFDELDSASSEEFKDSTGAYKDVCKWKGIVCNGRRRVVRVELHHYISGTLNLSYLPGLVQTFSTIYEREETQPVYGTLDTSALPSQLLVLNVAFSRLNGAVDFRRLPSTLEHLDLSSNDFSGSVHMTSLPRKLESFCLEGNEFCGSIQLTSLPETLESLILADNVLSGSLNFSNLPNSLDFINLNDNCFTGSISLDRLPQKLEYLLLDGNNLSGQFVLTSPPDGLQELSASGNLLSGTAVIPRDVMDVVQLTENPLEMVVDEFGEDSTWYMPRIMRKNA